MSCRNKKIRAMLGAIVLTASMTVTAVGCSSTSAGSTETADAVTESQTETAEVSNIDGILDSSDMFTNRDKEIGYDEESAIAINLSDGASTADSDSVVIDGDTITITEEGTYILSGSLTNGQIVVEAENAKVQLVLDNADISCETSAAIYVKAADKVFITTTEGSTNTVCTSGEFEAIDDNNIDAAIFSKSDLTLNGAGSLEVTCPNGHGILSKDDLVITSGEYVVDAGKHALSGKDSVRIAGGTFDLTAGKDGIHSENTDEEEKGFVYIENGSFTITSDGDGIDASYVVEIVDGSFDITAGGGYENGEVHTDNDMMGGFGNMGGQMQDGSTGDGNAPSDMTPPDGSTGEGNAPSGMTPPDGSTSDGNAPSGMTPPDGSTGEGNAPSGMTSPDGNSGTDSTTTTSADESSQDSNVIMLSAAGSTISDNADTADSTDAAASADAENSAGTASSTDTAETSDSDSSTSTKGIKADGALQILGGDYNINSADDAFHTNSTLEIRDGNMEIATGDDGIHADDALVISDGDINITESYEGIEGLTITIDGGNISIVSSDDGLNAAGGADSSGFGGMGTDMFASNDDIWIEINGGYLYVLAGGDGVDSNGNLTISGGEVYIDGPSDGGNSAIDYGDNAAAYINGGTVVAVGSSDMVEAFDASSEQAVMSVSVSAGSAGDEIKLLDSDGNELISFTAAKIYDAVIISTADLAQGESYTLVTGDNETTVEMTSSVYSNISRQQGQFTK